MTVSGRPAGTELRGQTTTWSSIPPVRRVPARKHSGVPCSLPRVRCSSHPRAAETADGRWAACTSAPRVTPPSGAVSKRGGVVCSTTKRMVRIPAAAAPRDRRGAPRQEVRFGSRAASGDDVALAVGEAVAAHPAAPATAVTAGLRQESPGPRSPRPALPPIPFFPLPPPPLPPPPLPLPPPLYLPRRRGGQNPAQALEKKRGQGQGAERARERQQERAQQGSSEERAQAPALAGLEAAARPQARQAPAEAPARQATQLARAASAAQLPEPPRHPRALPPLHAPASATESAAPHRPAAAAQHPAPDPHRGALRA